MQRGVKRPVVGAALAASAVAGGIWCLAASRASVRPPDRVPLARMQRNHPQITKPTNVTESPPPAFDRYRSLLDRNPFAPKLSPLRPAASGKGPAQAAPALPPAQGTEQAGPAAAAQAAPAAPPGPGPHDPLKDWVYSGTVAIGPEVYAVVENKAARRSEYLREEDPFQGGTVLRIATGALLLSFGSETRSLPKSTAFNATPLNAMPAAAPAAPGGIAGRPGGPGTPAQPAGAPPAASGPGSPAGPGALAPGPPPAAGAVPAGAPPGAVAAPAAQPAAK